MSWGYFLDVELELPTAEWQRLVNQTPISVGLPDGWWGFQDPTLDRYFSGPEGDGLAIGEAVGMFPDGESIARVEHDGGRTRVRIVAHLDRSGDTAVAKPFAALLEGARGSARGYVALVNDGTYDGEDGVRVDARDGALHRSRITDSNALVEELGMQIYGDLDDGEGFDDEG